jgi:hypothetical protein
VARWRNLDEPGMAGRPFPWLKIDWTGSARATFTVTVGEVARYQCAAYDMAFRPARQWRAALRRAPWIDLVQAEL